MSQTRTDLYGDPLRRCMTARMGTLRYRHDRPVSDLAFALDGRMVATTTDSGRVVVWKAATGMPLLSVDAEVPLLAVALSANGECVAASGQDGSIRVWDSVHGALLHTLSGHSEAVLALDISPDGRWIASGGGALDGADVDRQVRVWRLEQGRPSRVLEGIEGAVRDVAFSPDGWRLAVVGEGRVQVWRVDGWELEHTLEGHKGAVHTASFSPDGEVVVTAGDDGVLRIWDLSDGSCRRSVDLGVRLCTSDVSKTGDVLVGDARGTIHVFALDGEAHSFAVSGRALRGTAWSPDGEVILAASFEDRAVRLWARDGRAIVKGEGHLDRVVEVTWLGDQVASLSADGELRRWDAERGKPLEARLEAGASCVFSMEGELLVGAAEPSDGAVEVFALAASDGRVVRATSAGVFERGVELPLSSLVACAVYVDSERVQAAGPGGVFGCVGPESFPGDAPMAFSPDGVLLGVGMGSQLQSWDTREGDAMPSMDMKDGRVTALCFDSRRRYAAVGDDQGRIGVFATSDGSLLDVLLGHVGPVRSVQFDATSTRLVSGGDDTTVLAWLLELPDPGR